MIYLEADLDQEHRLGIHHLMSPTSLGGRDRTRQVTGPTIIKLKDVRQAFDIMNRLYTHELEGVPGYAEYAERTLAGQPASVDILIEEFSDAEGRPLEYPFTIPPEGTVIGLSRHRYKDIHMPCGLLNVETRSGIARKGLACMGFYTGDDTKPFIRWKGELNFTLRNYSGNALAVTGPFSPVQVTLTKDMDIDLITTPPVRIFRHGEDVTEESKAVIGKFTGYKMTLSDDLVYMKKSGEPVVVNGNGVEQVAIRGTVKDVHKQEPDFCLTITEEEVHTNGCPAYIYPFHYLDAVQNEWFLRDTSTLSDSFYKVFGDSRYMPVTANAGLINPGTNWKVVCENITKGRDMEKYFQVGKPFALVIPVPYYHGELDAESYNGSRRNQDKIVF